MPRRGQDLRRRVRKEPRRPSLGAGGWRRSRVPGARGPRVPAVGRGFPCLGRVARVFRREVLLEGLLFLFFLVGGPPVIPRPVVALSRVTGPQQQLAGQCWDGPIVWLLLDLYVACRYGRPDVGGGGGTTEASEEGAPSSASPCLSLAGTALAARRALICS